MTKIIGTIGRYNDTKFIRKAIKEGLDVIRLNFSHGSPDKFNDVIKNICKANDRLGTSCKVLGDTQGIEIRTCSSNDEVPFIKTQKGDTLYISNTKTLKYNEFGITHFEDVYNKISSDDTILVDDGELALKVLWAEILDEGKRIAVEALNDGVVKEHKGVNIPSIHLDIPFISDKDKKDIQFMVDNNFDFLALSFVRSAEDIQEVNNYITSIKENSDIKIISKIECREAVNNLDSIIENSYGIMVARGDLGVEIDYWEVPELQKTIVEKTKSAGKEVIVATQMLDSMSKNPRPTRAEVTDVWNAKNQRADYTMLSGETGAGKYPIEAIRVMKNIINKA